MQGETVSIEFTSADASTAAAVTIKDSDLVTRTLASNERLLIDSLNANIATGVTVSVINDTDADGNIDAGERIAELSINTVVAEFGAEGFSCKTGFTPKVKASGAGAVTITGMGRIVARGVDGVTRPAYKNTLLGR